MMHRRPMWPEPRRIPNSWWLGSALATVTGGNFLFLVVLIKAGMIDEPALVISSSLLQPRSLPSL
jgi:hypothetical protein